MDQSESTVCVYPDWAMADDALDSILNATIIPDAPILSVSTPPRSTEGCTPDAAGGLRDMLEYYALQAKRILEGAIYTYESSGSVQSTNTLLHQVCHCLRGMKEVVENFHELEVTSTGKASQKRLRYVRNGMANIIWDTTEFVSECEMYLQCHMVVHEEIGAVFGWVPVGGQLHTFIRIHSTAS